MIIKKQEELKSWIKESLIEARNFEDFIFILKDRYNVESKIKSPNIYYKHPDSDDFIKDDNLGARYMMWYLKETFK